LPPGGGAAGRPPARQGGGRLPVNIKAEVPPPTPAFAANNIQREKGETWDEGESCNNETLPYFNLN